MNNLHPGRPHRRRRRGRGLLAAATVLTMATGTLAFAENAHAESGRRICEYSFKAHPRNYEERLMRISLGMDYEKDGACPTLEAQRLVATGLVDWNQIFPNPVEKWTCEDWGRTHNTYLSDLGADPCRKMRNDNIYAFYWQDPTTPNAQPPHADDLAHWKVYS